MIPLESRDRRKLEEIINIIDKQDERIKALENTNKTIKKPKKNQPLKRWRSNSLRIKKHPRTRLSCFNVKTKLLKVKTSYFELSKIILVR